MRLTKKAEDVLIQKAQNGDMDSIQILMEAAIPYITKIVKKYENESYSEKELIEETIIDILESIHRYVKNPYQTYKVYLHRIINYFFQKKIREKKEMIETIPLENLIWIQRDPFFEVDQKEMKIAIREVLKTLTDREKDVLSKKYGIDEKIHTRKEIGEYYGVTEERVRQIQDKALRKLRHPSRKIFYQDWIPQFPSKKENEGSDDIGSVPILPIHPWIIKEKTRGWVRFDYEMKPGILLKIIVKKLKDRFHIDIMGEDEYGVDYLNWYYRKPKYKKIPRNSGERFGKKDATKSFSSVLVGQEKSNRAGAQLDDGTSQNRMKLDLDII